MAESSNIPEFATPEQVSQICGVMQTAENLRARDRALIDNLANGGRPYTPAEVEKYQIAINVNWGGLNKKTQDANRQINNATLHTGQFFAATSRRGPIEKRDEYGRKFTSNIQRRLKKGAGGRKHYFLIRNRNAAMTLHGLGPLLWTNDHGWLARNIALEDLLIPTDTLIDFSNLTHFAVNMSLTAGELVDMTHGEKVRKGWDLPAVRKVLKDLSVKGDSKDNYDWVEQPERMVELFKQNRCAIDTDRIPRVRIRLFLFQDKDSKKWFRRIMLRGDTANVMAKDGFLFKSEEPFAENISQILHVQFGDNVLNAPLKYHSVRGVGTMLYAPEEASNRMMCQFFQHCFEQLLQWFRISDPIDQARLKAVVLRQYGILEDGMSVVPQNERHQIDPGLVESALSKFRQIMSEQSASYVQDINDGTKKEMTAFETKARLSNVNVMVSGTLQGMYLQEGFYYEEVVRRFLRKNSEDDEVKRFQSDCKQDGIPDELMTPDNWNIEVEKVLGGGDRMMAQQEADALLSQSARFDPSRQRIIARKWVVATTNDPAMGDLLVPDAPDTATSGTKEAENVFATLMEGIPITLREGIEQIDYTEAMLGMMTAKVEKIKATGGMGTPEDVSGLVAVAGDIEKHIQILAADEANNLRVKEYSDQLGGLMNEVKAFAQRQKEAAAKAGEQGDVEAQAKAQAMLLQAQTKAQISEATAVQKMEQRQQQFEQKMMQDLEKSRLELEKFMANAQAELIASGLKTAQEVEAAKAKADAAPAKTTP